MAPGVEEGGEDGQSEADVESEQPTGGTGKTTDGKTCLNPGN